MRNATLSAGAATAALNVNPSDVADAPQSGPFAPKADKPLQGKGLTEAERAARSKTLKRHLRFADVVGTIDAEMPELIRSFIKHDNVKARFGAALSNVFDANPNEPAPAGSLPNWYDWTADNMKGDNSRYLWETFREIRADFIRHMRIEAGYTASQGETAWNEVAKARRALIEGKANTRAAKAPAEKVRAALSAAYRALDLESPTDRQVEDRAKIGALILAVCGAGVLEALNAKAKH